MKIARLHIDSRQVEVLTRLPNVTSIICPNKKCRRQWLLHRERTVQWKCSKCGLNLYYLALGDQFEKERGDDPGQRNDFT